MGILLNPELESRIAAKVQSGRYGSPAEVIQEGLDLLEARDAALPKRAAQAATPVWKTIAQLGQEIPEEEWSQVPLDLASNVDHHLYGSPKASE
jgi:putative addiction module CopG family antidote